MKKIVQALTLLLFSWVAAQTNNHLDSGNHLYWEKGIHLKASDFRGDGKEISNAAKYCDTVGLCTVGAFGMFAVLDIPKRKRKRGRLREKVYIVPAFEYAKSYRIKEDSLGVEKQQIVFDIHELSARWMRRELKSMVKKMDAYGTLSIWFKTIEGDTQKMTQQMIDAYTHDVFITPEPGAYQKWKAQIDEKLEELAEFITTKEEIQRFTSGGPIREDYKMADHVVGNLFGQEQKD